MQTFPYIEDYLELLGGYSTNGYNCTIKLARYDISIVGNMSSNTAYGVALTDRQADLAVKLVLKYRRQFFKQGVDVTPAETPQYRLPLRKVDRKATASLENDMIVLRFPYNRPMIDQLHDQKTVSHGRMEYFRKDRKWQIALTEPNVKWCYEWIVNNGFDIDPKLQELYDIVETAETTPYEIKLIKTELGYDITNSSQSLKQYIQKELGGFDKDNTIKLLDNAGRLGYTVDDMIWQQDLKISDAMRSALEFLGGKHRCYVTPEPEMFEWVLDYVDMTDRYPVYIYDPHLNYNLQKIVQERFKANEIINFDDKGQTSSRHYTPESVKILYAVKIPTSWDMPTNSQVPMVISTVEMMYGGRRMNLINRAEKVVYYCNKLKE